LVGAVCAELLLEFFGFGELRDFSIELAADFFVEVFS